MTILNPSFIPQGRAAQRLAESVGMDAKTIHRLLEYKPGEAFWGKNGDTAEETDVTDLPRNFFARDARNPLEVRRKEVGKIG